MGRPFQQELAKLPANISFALKHPVTELTDAMEVAKGGRLLACGAGGSYSAACFTQLLFQEAGFDAQAVTPLHVLQSARPFEPTTLFLFTASGRNKDVLRVIEHASRQSIQVVLVCASKGSPAAKLAGKYPANRVYDFSYPTRRDGFLAVNSLAVTWWLLARAFGHAVPRAEAAVKCLQESYDVDFVAPDRRHACVLLHDRWTRPVAIDLESKMSEAALCAPLVSDWRQFGHGRHHWLAKNAEFSSVLSIESRESRPLATKSLRLIPATIPRRRLTATGSGIAAICELLLRSFVYIGAVGRRVGIDPGRPGVPPFGSALYHLAAPLPRTHRDPGPWYFTEGIARKLDAIGIRNPSSDTKATVRQAAESFHERLLQAKFSAIVLDFDGTIAPAGLMPDQPLPKEITAALLPLLKKGVIVGIATGRGDSCHGNLAKSFPAAVWPQLLVSHYNGASVGNLRDLLKNPIEWPEDQALAAVAGELQADPLLAALARISFKNVQITLRPKSKNDARTVCRLVSARIARMGYVRLVTSSHSLDIVPAATTKLALIDHVRCNHGAESVILTVGDRGDLEGNDFQLLSEPLSLSVDRVSPDLRTCWNFLPYDVSHFAGTSHYLQHTQTNQGTFRFRPK